MKNYLLLIMLIIGSFGGLVIADNYGAFEEVEIPEGSITNNSYGEFNDIPDDFELWTDLNAPYKIAGDSEGGAADIISKDAEYMSEYDTWVNVYKIQSSASPGQYGDIDVQFRFYPPEYHETNKDGLETYEKMWDLYDLYLYADIFVDGPSSSSSDNGVIDHCSLEYVRYPSSVSEEYAPRESDYYGETITLIDEDDTSINPIEIRGLALDRCLYFRITGNIQKGTKIIVDRMRVIMRHQGILGENWQHSATAGGFDVYDTESWTSTGDLKKTFEKSSKYRFNIDGGSITHDEDIGFNLDWKYSADGDVKKTWGWDDATTGDHKFWLSGDMPSKTLDDQSSDDWNFHEPDEGYNTKNWDDDVEGREYYIKCKCQAQANVMSGWGSRLDIWMHYKLNSETYRFSGYGFDNYNYPSIINLRYTPEKVPAAGNLQIEFEPHDRYPGAYISYAEVFLIHASDEEWNTNHGIWYRAGELYDTGIYRSDSDNDLSDGLDAFDDLIAGEYTAWVRVYDSEGQASISQIRFSYRQDWATANFVGIEDHEQISELTDIQIDVNVFADDSYLSHGVNYSILDENKIPLVDYQPMTKIDSFEPVHRWRAYFDPIDFGNGDYYVAVKVADDWSKSVCYKPIVLNNRVPDIEFINPSGIGPVIREFTDYDIKVKITDEEYDPFDNVSLCFYSTTYEGGKDEQVTPWLNMTNMPDIYGDPTDYWNFTFDPINFTNGDHYYLEVRVNSTYGFNYNGTLILFERLDPLIEFVSEDDSRHYEIRNGDVPFEFEVDVVQGELSISNFTYYIATDFGLTNIFQNQTLEYNSGQTRYKFSIEPRLLKNDDYYLGVVITNHSGYALRPQYAFVNVEYYLNNTIEKDIYNYDIKNEIYYPKDGVMTNSFIRANVEIEYLTEDNPLTGYNYMFDVGTHTIQDYVHPIYPDYEIPMDTYTATPVSEITTSEELFFEFFTPPQEKTTNLYFNMPTPTLELREDFEKPETSTRNGRNIIKIEVRLDADHYFTNLQCVYRPQLPISSADNYEYSLYVMQLGKWEMTDIPVTFSSGASGFDQKWQFPLEEVAKDSPEVLDFLIEGVSIDGMDVNWGPIIFASMGAGVVGLLSLYFVPQKTSLLKKNRTLRKRKWVYYVIAGGLTAGLGLGIFFGTSMMGATIAATML